jgi:hypothetical protein
MMPGRHTLIPEDQPEQLTRAIRDFVPARRPSVQRENT